MDDKKIKVSACIITYNHEKFISQAIEGALAQRIDHDYEIVIGEDHSTDKTKEIVMRYQKENPGIIRVLYNEKNLGMMGNWINTINACKGEYVAILEGDDYWTDPLKLKKQIDFLDSHPEYSISSHNVDVVYEDSDKPSVKWFHYDEDRDYSLEDILRGESSPTCSLVYRNKVFGEFPAWFKEQAGADGSLHLLCAEKGKMRCLHETMGAYRVHNQGAYSARVKEAKEKGIDLPKYLYDNAARCLDAFDKHLGYKYKGLIDIKRNYNEMNAFSAYALAGDFEGAKKHGKRLLKLIPSFSFKNNLKTLFKLAVIYSLPKNTALSILHLFRKR